MTFQKDSVAYSVCVTLSWPHSHFHRVLFMVRFRSLAPVLSSGRKQKVVVRRAGIGFPRNATEAGVLLGSGTEREYAIPSVYLLETVLLGYSLDYCALELEEIAAS
jgi:hypothetical protein